ncbi:two component, sigma54 specific, transcriptional regulator, Fis family [Alkalispirochaeta americana]|uniref:Two component, sigma54 specific, transcriptional regulator, Fis family n=1 Tax=Alkalispirochaeta americana TaxID=159291 RepID=A0A1N6UH02_9SPIO|nr:sigma-54 dependent transcriptional regulator [Alkalispirochaeta americana]SIQ64741.1 two component, sigma54 specific, transcriptional regulator, Fis family [Alkalispirochaeta americana]
MKSTSPAILLVDDDPVALQIIQRILQANGFGNVELCSESLEALEMVKTRSVAVMLLDLFMPKRSGFEVLQQMVQDFPDIPVIVLTSDDTIDAAVRCMKIGAFDFMTKPVDRHRLASAVNHALRVRELEKRLTLFGEEPPEEVAGPREPGVFSGIITRSPRMQAIFQYIEAIAPSPKAVLITGESGTGKELLARAIHQAGDREGPFVAVNVAGLDDVLFSDTLFGHLRGAFTGADRSRGGLVERAQGGTLFLDEIGDLEPLSQVKLLRLIQEGEYYPLGSDEPRQASIRIVAATNADLLERQHQGTFRKDLYYRLVSHRIRVPALRERREDIPLLVDHFVAEAAAELGEPAPAVSDDALRLLARAGYPGNIRELQAIVADAVSRARGGELPLSVIREYFRTTQGESVRGDFGEDQGVREGAGVSPGGGRSLAAGEVSPEGFQGERLSWSGSFPMLAEAERFLITEALRRCDNNQTAAAQLLGVSQSTLSRWLRKNAPGQNA